MILTDAEISTFAKLVTKSGFTWAVGTHEPINMPHQNDFKRELETTWYLKNDFEALIQHRQAILDDEDALKRFGDAVCSERLGLNGTNELFRMSVARIFLNAAPKTETQDPIILNIKGSRWHIGAIYLALNVNTHLRDKNIEINFTHISPDLPEYDKHYSDWFTKTLKEGCFYRNISLTHVTPTQANTNSNAPDTNRVEQPARAALSNEDKININMVARIAFHHPSMLHATLTTPEGFIESMNAKGISADEANARLRDGHEIARATTERILENTNHEFDLFLAALNPELVGFVISEKNKPLIGNLLLNAAPPNKVNYLFGTTDEILLLFKALRFNRHESINTYAFYILLSPEQHGDESIKTEMENLTRERPTLFVRTVNPQATAVPVQMPASPDREAAKVLASIGNVTAAPLPQAPQAKMPAKKAPKINIRVMKTDDSDDDAMDIDDDAKNNLLMSPDTLEAMAKLVLKKGFTWASEDEDRTFAQSKYMGNLGPRDKQTLAKLERERLIILKDEETLKRFAGLIRENTNKPYPPSESLSNWVLIARLYLNDTVGIRNGNTVSFEFRGTTLENRLLYHALKTNTAMRENHLHVTLEDTGNDSNKQKIDRAYWRASDLRTLYKNGDVKFTPINGTVDTNKARDNEAFPADVNPLHALQADMSAKAWKSPTPSSFAPIAATDPIDPTEGILYPAIKAPVLTAPDEPFSPEQNVAPEREQSRTASPEAKATGKVLQFSDRRSYLGKRSHAEMSVKPLHPRPETVLQQQGPIGCMGWEIEMPQHVGSTPDIQVKFTLVEKNRKKKETRTPMIVSVDDFFDKYDPPEDGRECAYDQFVAKSKAGVLTLDVDTIDDKHYYLLELASEPFLLYPAVEGDNTASQPAMPHLNRLTSSLKNIYTAVDKDRDVTQSQTFSLTQLAQQATAEHSAEYKMKTSDDEGEFIGNDRAQDAEFLFSFKKGMPNKPIFLVQSNISVPLEAMFSMETRDAFPIFSEAAQFNALVEGTDYKPWPCEKPNADFDTWEKNLTVFLNKRTHWFIENFFQSLTPYSKARLEGFFRTYFYTASMLVYDQSELKDEHFPKNEFNTDCEKDLFLHGLPKMSFNAFAKDCLTDSEKVALRDFFSNRGGLVQMNISFLSILHRNKLPYDADVAIGVDDKCKSFKSKEFFKNSLIKPLESSTPDDKLYAIIPKVLDRTTAQIEVEGEKVRMPVLEFRSPKGNFCDMASLDQLVQDGTQAYIKFATGTWKKAEALKAQAGPSNNNAQDDAAVEPPPAKKACRGRPRKQQC